MSGPGGQRQNTFTLTMIKQSVDPKRIVRGEMVLLFVCIPKGSGTMSSNTLLHSMFMGALFPTAKTEN